MGKKLRDAKRAALNRFNVSQQARYLYRDFLLVPKEREFKLAEFVQPLLLLITLCFCLIYVTNAPVTLFAGALIGILLRNPYPKITKSSASLLLGISVTSIGFRSEFSRVVSSLVDMSIVAGMVVASLIIGLMLGKRLGLSDKLSLLIASGTAICGGSAIMATARASDATEEETAASLATIFLFNALGLVALPLLALEIELDSNQFGLWSALAIHDTASVIAASMEFGPAALAYATTVKLFRALFIIPIVILVGLCFSGRRSGRNYFKMVPWFIPGFFLAAFLTNFLPSVSNHINTVTTIAKVCMLSALFLLGTTLTRKGLLSVGIKPFILGLLLWLPVTMISLLVALLYY